MQWVAAAEAFFGVTKNFAGAASADLIGYARLHLAQWLGPPANVVPADRGRLRAVLSVDRRAAEIDGRLAVMADLRFERAAKTGDARLHPDHGQRSPTHFGASAPNHLTHSQTHI